MAAQALQGSSTQSASAEISGSALRYVARQPIMDLRGKVHAYELLFRAGLEAGFCGDGDIATRTMLDNAVIFGIEKLTGGLPAFLNCTAEALTGELVNVLPSNMTVLEILENIEPTQELIGACRKLRNAGFRLALDDFVWEPKFEPLVELADYIKVDFVLSGPDVRQSLMKRVRGKKIVMLAEKVETQEEYKQACDEGFTLFQGYYFCRPALMQNRKVPENQFSHIEILQLLRGDSLDLRKLTTALKRDASLTYRLLRLVNSPMCAMRQEIRSIHAALVAVGEDTFRRIATLAIAGEFNANRPAEILRMAFVRGRFCELAADLCKLDPTEQYLLGMLSLLPAMMRLPMEELAPSLPLREEVREALLGAAGAERAPLQWLESHEKGDWAAGDEVVQTYHLNEDELVAFYAEAVVWAESALKSAT